jgi:autotransporter-associated beta strand protein
LTVPAGSGFGGYGTITDPVVCQGTITATPSGAINLTDGLQISGTGQVNLGLGTLTFSDSTSGISGGLLSLSGLTQGSGSAAFNLSGGTFQAASSFSTSVPIVLGTPGSNAVFDTSGNTLTLAGPISGPGGLQVGDPGSLTATGAGMLILSGTNSYTGGTIVEAGTLIVTANTALADGSSLAVGAGGVFVFDPTVTGAPLANASPAGAVASVPEPGTLALLAVAGIVAAAAVWRRRTS